MANNKIFKRQYDNIAKLKYAAKIGVFNFAIILGYLVTGFDIAFSYAATTENINLFNVIINTQLIATALVPISIIVALFISYRAAEQIYIKLNEYTTREQQAHRAIKGFIAVNGQNAANTIKEQNSQSLTKDLKSTTKFEYVYHILRALTSSISFFAGISSFTGLHLFSMNTLVAIGSVSIPTMVIPVVASLFWINLCVKFYDESKFIDKAKKLHGKLKLLYKAVNLNTTYDLGLGKVVDDTIKQKQKEQKRELVQFWYKKVLHQDYISNESMAATSPSIS